MGEEGFVTVTRHPLEHRIWHWVFVVTMGMLILTGIEMYFGLRIFGGFSLARSWHVLFAFIAVSWAYPIFLYLYWVTGELKELVPARSDVRTFGQIAKNFLGLSTFYPEHSTYDIEAKKYIRKYNPGQKMVYWGILLFLLVEVLTGFALLWPDAFGFVALILGNMAMVRALHLAVFYVILGLVVVHIYMATIPQNWGSLRSMFLGVASERVHKPDP